MASAAWDNVKLVVLMAFGAVIGLTIFSTISNSITFVPALYTELRPIVRFGYRDRKTGRFEAAVQSLYRDSEKACWSLYIEKLSAGEPISYTFWASAGETSAVIPTASYAVYDNNAPDTLKVLVNHEVGEQWHRRYCFAIADRLPDFKDISVSGKAAHDRFPYLWRTVTPTPEFTIPRL